MKHKMNSAFSKAKEISKQTAGAVSSTAKSVTGAAGEIVAKQTEIISEKIEDKKRREVEERELEVKAAKEIISDTIAERFLSMLGDSPVELTKKRINQIKSVFPIPREQCVLWADAEFDLRPSGIVVTDKGVFIKTDVAVFEKKKHNTDNACKSALYYYQWENFEPSWFTEIDDDNKALSVDKECYGKYIEACKALSLKEQDDNLFYYLGNHNDTDIGTTVAKTAPAAFSGVVSSETTVFAEQKSHVNTTSGHGEMAEEAITYLDKLFGMDAKVVGRDNAKDGADRFVNGVHIQTKYYKSATGSLEACFLPNKGTYRYTNPDGTPMQLEVPKDQYEKVLSGFKNKIKNGQVPGITDPNEAKNIVRRGRLTYKQAVNLTKPGTIESLAYDAATGIVTCSCAFGVSFVATMFLTWINTKNIGEAIQAGATAGIQVFGISFLQHMVVSQISRTGLASTLMKPSQFVVQKLGYKASATLVNGIRALSGKAPIYGAAASKQLAKIFRSNVLTSVITLAVFSVPETYKLLSKKSSNAQYVKNMSSLAGSVLGGAGGAVAAGVVASKIAGAAGTAVAPGVGTAVGIAGGFVGGFAGAKAADVVGNIIHESDTDTIGRLFNAVTSCVVNEYLLNDNEIQGFVESMNQVSQKEFKELFGNIQTNNEQESVIRDFLEPKLDEIVMNREQFSLPSDEEMDRAFSEIEKELSEG